MTRAVEIVRITEGAPMERRSDDVALESALEIRVEGQRVAMAMRTPGHDRELAAGWALSEGIIRAAEDLVDVVSGPTGESEPSAMVDVMLKHPDSFEFARHQRNVLTNASCGLCGAGSIDAILRKFPKIGPTFRIDATRLHRLPVILRSEQRAFARTGGMHACALFDASGEMIALREDVGRHNALDKLLGWALLAHRLPLSAQIVLLSGRVSLEMVQKALSAQIPIVAAIGAPTSLSVELAQQTGITLIGFLRETSMNVYSGAERLHGAGGL